MDAFYDSSPSFGLATVESESSPWQTSQAPGASLEGTLGQQAAQTWGMGAPQPGNPFGLEDALTIAGQQQARPDPIASLGQFQAQMVQSRQEEPPPIGSITRKADGTTDLKGVSSAFLEDVMAQMNDLKTMKSAAMARVAQLRQQEASGSPILDALSQFAGGMAANDPTMPGWVRALGATNLQMGPQGIKRERMAEEARAFQYGNAAADLGMGLEKFQTQKALVEQQKALGVQEKIQSNWEQLKTSINSNASKGILPDKNYFFREGLSLGKDFTALESEWKNAETLAKGYLDNEKVKADRDIEKAVATEKGKAPIRIEVAEKVGDIRTADAKELIAARGSVANSLADKRYRQFQDRIITRMDANRVQELAKVPAKVRENLIATSEMEQFLERLETYVGPNGSLRGKVGPLQGFITGALPSALSDSDRQVVQHLFGVEKKRVIDFARAGVRGWAPGEDAIRKVGMLETLTPDAAGRVIEEIRHQININRTAATQAYRYAPWDQTPELLGGPNSPIYKAAASKSGEFFDALEGVHRRAIARENDTGGGAPQTVAPKPKRPWEK